MAGLSPLELMERGGFRAVQEFLTRPYTCADLLLFEDDHLTRGGLLALAVAGVKVPGELRVATLSNRAFCPQFTVALARVESDPQADADAIAELALGLLRGNNPPTAPLVTTLGFILGDSL